MTPRELMYKFSKGQIKLDEKNAKELEKLIKGVSNEFLVWWSEFVDKNPDYTHANDSHRPDKDLLDELKEYADDNDIKLTAVRNNDIRFTFHDNLPQDDITTLQDLVQAGAQFPQEYLLRFAPGADVDELTRMMDEQANDPEYTRLAQRLQAVS